jgi:hypothetical protein
VNILGFNGVVLSMVGEVSIDSNAEFAGSIFKDARRAVCVRTLIRISVRVS